MIACDGLWDVITDDDVSAQVVECLDNGKSASETAECLINTAMEKCTTDNVSVIVVIF